MLPVAQQFCTARSDEPRIIRGQATSNTFFTSDHDVLLYTKITRKYAYTVHDAQLFHLSAAAHPKQTRAATGRGGPFRVRTTKRSRRRDCAAPHTHANTRTNDFETFKTLTQWCLFTSLTLLSPLSSECLCVGGRVNLSRCRRFASTTGAHPVADVGISPPRSFFSRSCAPFLCTGAPM